MINLQIKYIQDVKTGRSQRKENGMEPGVLLRIIIILVGVVLFCVTLFSLAKRRMTESFCLTWGFISVIIILAGILLRPTELASYISSTGMILVGIAAFCVIYGAYFISIKVSELMRRNLELTMQVSLLRKENEEIIDRMQELIEGKETAKAEDGEK